LEACDRTVPASSHHVYEGAIPTEDLLQGPSIMTGPQDPSVDRPDGSVVFPRPDGVVSFARHDGPSLGPSTPQNSLGPQGGIADWGDLNGDGDPDYVINAVEGTYVISGGLAAGVYNPAKVGVRLVDPATGPGIGAMRPVGDQNGDGADDIALNGHLYSMKPVLAHARGSEARLPRPFRSVSHLSVTPAMKLRSAGPPALVQVFGGFGADASVDDPIEIVLAQGPTRTCLVTGNRDLGPMPARYYDTQGVDARLVDGHRVVEIVNSTRNTLVSTDEWDLDA
jgi:hypothetical protein